MLIFLSSCRKGDNSNNETAVGVKVETVGIVTDNNSQFYSGTVKEENGVALSFINGGTIERMAVDEGQYVKKGQLIQQYSWLRHKASCVRLNHKKPLQVR